MKNSKFKAVITMTIVAFFFTLNTNAQSQNRQERKEPPTFKQLLKEMDKNEDGKLSKKEVKGPLKNDFSKIDINEDGFISEKELENAPKPKRERQQGDRN